MLLFHPKSNICNFKWKECYFQCFLITHSLITLVLYLTLILLRNSKPSCNVKMHHFESCLQVAWLNWVLSWQRFKWLWPQPLIDPVAPKLKEVMDYITPNSLKIHNLDLILSSTLNLNINMLEKISPTTLFCSIVIILEPI